MSDPFAEPRGLLGAIAGRIMAGGNAGQQQEVLAAMQLSGDERVLEIGHGPGVLARLVLEAHPSTAYTGVDPSEVMQRQAGKRNPSGARFLIGTAASIPLEDASVDVAVAVNNVRMWPDVGAAAREIRRVLAPGGRLFVSWHSSRSKSFVQKRLGLPGDEADRIADALAAVFPTVERRELPSSDLFVAS